MPVTIGRRDLMAALGGALRGRSRRSSLAMLEIGLLAA
jgi:hypothetical protein